MSDPRPGGPALLPDRDLVRTACEAWLADEPPGTFALADVERRGRRVVTRRRAVRGTAAVAASVAVGAGLALVGPWGPGGSPGVRVTSGGPPPGASGTGGSVDPGGSSGTGLATGFPLGDAHAAVVSALPTGVGLDASGTAGWERGAGTVAQTDVVLVGADGTRVVARLGLAPECWLHDAAPVLDDAAAARVARAVCDAWSAVGRADPLATGPEQTLNPSPVDPAA